MFMFFQLKIMKINDFASMLVNSEKDYVNTEVDASVMSQLAIPASAIVYLGGIELNSLSSSALPQQIKSQVYNFLFSLSLKVQFAISYFNARKFFSQNTNLNVDPKRERTFFP